MAHRFALILVLLTAVPASAQDWEIEAGAGLWLLNPARVADFDVRSTPSVNVAWTHWYDEQSGWTVGVHAMPRYGDGERMLFGHVTYRHRWIHDDEGSFTHVSFGAGPTVFHEDVPAGYSWPSYHFRFLWHVEAMKTERIRDGLSLRVGFTITPLLYIPLVVQPVAMVLWSP